jgi:excisionase family DNA binding protein
LQQPDFGTESLRRFYAIDRRLKEERMSVQTISERAVAGDLDADELLTVSAVARIFNVGRPSVYRLLANGSLGAIRIGGSIRVPRREVRAFLARNTALSKLDPERETVAH